VAIDRRGEVGASAQLVGALAGDVECLGDIDGSEQLARCHGLRSIVFGGIHLHPSIAPASSDHRGRSRTVPFSQGFIESTPMVAYAAGTFVVVGLCVLAAALVIYAIYWMIFKVGKE
jgi:hypothetical protein